MSTVPISVVIPTVDRPGKLSRCLEAVASGSVRPAATVVVDQGGNLETAEAIARLNEAGFPIHHVRAPLRGLSAARNVGVSHVSTPWVAFTDDDCVPDRAWLEAIQNRAALPDAPDGVTGRVLPLGDKGDGHTLSLRVSTDPRLHRAPAYPWRVGTGGNTAVRTDVLRGLAGYDERLGTGSPGAAGEDVEVIHRLLHHGHSFAYEPSVIVYHARVGQERRLATRLSYGFGMGAYVGVWLRQDPWVRRVLVRWTLERCLNLSRAARRFDGPRIREEWRLLHGLAGGMVYGWRLRRPVGPTAH